MRTKLLIAFVLLTSVLTAAADSIPSGFARSPEFRGGIEIAPAFVPGTNRFLRGQNSDGRTIRANLGGELRADFSFNSATREGMLYKETYQGLGIGINSFFANRLLGTPVSAFIYQGAPFLHFGDRLSLGYEWQFGAAMGWKHYDSKTAWDNGATSTPVTALMGLSVKLRYLVSDRWLMTFGINARHYSNGNTSLPNAGVNTIGASVGVSYIINPQRESTMPDRNLESEADRGRWFYDITAYGAWCKRVVTVGELPVKEVCPGKFGVAGIQFSPMRSFNRWVAAGASLDLQWDESAGLEDYWIEGTSDEYIKFTRPPFLKQTSLGVSAHAELTMPIFSLNAGMGLNLISPKGDCRFYQMLTLKAFITRRIFLNAGYRLGNFKDPQNLMLGVGIRL